MSRLPEQGPLPNEFPYNWAALTDHWNEILRIKLPRVNKINAKVEEILQRGEVFDIASFAEVLRPLWRSGELGSSDRIDAVGILFTYLGGWVKDPANQEAVEELLKDDAFRVEMFFKHPEWPNDQSLDQSLLLFELNEAVLTRLGLSPY